MVVLEAALELAELEPPAAAEVVAPPAAEDEEELDLDEELQAVATSSVAATNADRAIFRCISGPLRHAKLSYLFVIFTFDVLASQSHVFMI